MEVIDASSLVFDYLRSSEAIGATQVRGGLVLGSESVLETGMLSESLIMEAYEAREANSALAEKALFISVQDAGDEGAVGEAYVNYVICRVIDRGMAYSNIRRVKFLLQKYLADVIGNLMSGYGGASHIEYVGRTGHRFDPIYAIEYDALTFAGFILLPHSV